MAEKTAVDAYLKEAQSFEADRAANATKSARIAWRVASVAGLIAVVSVGAVAALTPLKTVELRTIRVDNSTGIVDIVPRAEANASYEETVNRLHLANYVRSRERFFWGIAEYDYEFVATQQTPQLNQLWADAWTEANPQSPLNLYKDGTIIKADIRSIVFLTLGSGKSVAQVRFAKSARPGGSGADQTTHWVATIEYTYTGPSKDDKIRTMNPLGFRVVSYQKEPEVVSAGESS